MPRTTALVSDPDYDLHTMPPGHPERVGRLPTILAHLRKTGLWDSLTHIDPKPAAPVSVAEIHTLDYIERICDDFTELQGDRAFGEDKSIVGGMALLGGHQVMLIGHQKGRNTKENLFRNFGMPHPEGYRKALRLMQLAGKFGRPIVTLVDTPGAYPGVEAEKRGQSEAIARNLREMIRIPVPIVVVIIGEGGSGGALALAVGDRILMLENSVYSVISPEGCAAILWGDRAQAPTAAEALKLTATDLDGLKVIDRIVEEPKGGAHRDVDAMATGLRDVLQQEISELQEIDSAVLLENRFQKFLHMGVFADSESGL